MTLIVKISDLVFLPDLHDHEENDAPRIADLIQKHFAFLSPEIIVSIRGDVAVIEFSEPSPAHTEEARRLASKGSRKAIQGEYSQAVEILRRALTLDPTAPEVHRDLAMSLYELGKMDEAKNELLDALRLDPENAGNLVVLGNIYLRHDRDSKSAEIFFTRALEIKPDDLLALNSLAAVHALLSRNDKALDTFTKAIQIAPSFPNARLGKALLELQMGNPESSLETLQGLFKHFQELDARAKPVISEARSRYLSIENQLASRTESEAFKILENFKAETAQASGFPIECQADATLQAQLSGVCAMAWKHGRDRHTIKTKPGLPPPDFLHVTGHELTHILLESRARAVGKNRFFSTNDKTTLRALDGFEYHINRMAKEGWPREKAEAFLRQICGFVCATLFNTPLDLRIESELFEKLPTLRHAQFVSLHRLANEAWEAVSKSHSQRLIPAKFLEPVTALNATAALFLDELSGGATAFWPLYSRLPGARSASRLFEIWKSRKTDMAPGKEYELVDEFADVLDLRGWYEWIPDSGSHEIKNSELFSEGTSNPDLLRQKQPAAVWHLVNALSRYDKLNAEQVREIAFEIGLLGREGLDYSNPDKTYSLRSLPGESFSGLHLMCLMFAGFKRIAPDMDIGMDLQEPWLQALALHSKKQGGI